MSREGNWLIMENRVRDGDILLPAERLSRSEHFVENDTQGPQVSASVCGLASDLLRGHIRHCPKTRSWFAQTLIARLSQPEVENLYSSVRQEHDVARLQVPVHDARSVCALQPFSHLLGDHDYLSHRYRAIPSQLGFQSSTWI